MGINHQREVEFMSINTKQGPVYEPTNKELLPLYNWLNQFSKPLDGSEAYNELIAIYESLEMDLLEKNIAEKNKRLAG
jgi:hypothetical protein